MRKFTCLAILLVIGAGLVMFCLAKKEYATVDPGSPDKTNNLIPLPEQLTWKRPDGPLKIGLQVGHWKQMELPDELENLRTSTGTSGGGWNEWEVNMKIAELVAEILEENMLVVDILPATIPPDYWADVFLSIHADGNTSSSASGYKVASPRFDRTGKTADLVRYLNESYGDATGIMLDPQITRNMRGYYAFNHRKYNHSIHPMTTAAIVETGFLTNVSDRKIIVDQPKLAARGIANGLLRFLEIND